MENAYIVVIIVFIILWCIITYKVCMSGYTTKEKNPDDYKEINEAQKKKDIETIKSQDKYDNEWGYIK